MIEITEQDSLFQNLEMMSTSELLSSINLEDQKVALAVQKELKSIEVLTNKVVDQLLSGGRLFYVGAGTSGRLGILDASECPPTFGVSSDLVIGIIAGGDTAIRNAVEGAEDNLHQCEQDLLDFQITPKDIVIGIAASGKTPYVLAGLKFCKNKGIPTGCIVCNPESPIAEIVDFPISVNLGPEFLTGSTRMKSGTAQKMILNMISTSAMIKSGYVKGNKMINMMLTNEKLKDRALRIIMQTINVSKVEAEEMISKEHSVRKVLEKHGF